MKVPGFSPLKVIGTGPEFAATSFANDITLPPTWVGTGVRGCPGTTTETGTGRLLVRLMVRVVSPAGTTSCGPGTVTAPLPRANPQTGTDAPFGMTMLPASARKSTMTASDRGGQMHRIA